jgi:hypothetical protein
VEEHDDGIARLMLSELCATLLVVVEVIGEQEERNDRAVPV